MTVLKTHAVCTKLLVALEQNGWSPDTIEMWKTSGQKRMMEFVVPNQNSEMALHVLEAKVESLCALLALSFNPKPLKFGVNFNKKVLQHSVHMMLIPAFFIQQCEDDMAQLQQWSV